MEQETGWYSRNRTTKEKSSSFIILEFKRMSDVTDQYIVRVRQVAEEKYVSLRTALSETLHLHGWGVKQVGFIAAARLLKEEDLRKNLQIFKVPQAGINLILSKLVMEIYNEYSSILRDMYNVRFNGSTTDQVIPTQVKSDTQETPPP